MILVTYQAPDFTAPAVLNTGEIVNDFNLKTYISNTTSIIFFWPMDFTFICPSELIACDKRHAEFKKRKVNVIGISGDSQYVHYAWRNTPIDQGGIGPIQYPMVADIKHEIMQAYGITHPKLGVALRATFLIDKQGFIRHQLINDLPLGRNFDEIIRMIDALQFHEKFGLVCPAQWKKDQEGMKASQSGVSQYLKKHIDKL
ncbi:peroxiredoxin C [Blochmannia endosymbiont of Polyrhachis (Hedomyrma) turneri]|uniref:peroxiredoxin C n=1 Tax=Blochmannia endosymbiont of Polyrhachis (Hedomyrma) turneri TaxID=1505596 RepID=UPI00061A697C|nr:peroxiredoxin C [Blochmannia endosymbiont of Polyrhachis (Hedomyrma) turneri]AKC59803.1 Alkyl hydroperoxide reductase subunit C [Blochmannia endosymbiont of Polyrhachis (Hedomyrma) turneri]